MKKKANENFESNLDNILLDNSTNPKTYWKIMKMLIKSISFILLLKSSKSIFSYCQISLVNEHEVDFEHLRKATAAS
jgi:hypothetical protein